MKKITVLAAFCAIVFAAGAQSLNVSSAYEAWHRGYLKKAKGYIDEATKHDQTKEDGQTWFYSTMIYCSIGDEITKNSKKGRELAAEASDWYRKAYTSLYAWKQFDKKGEYTSKINPFFGYVAKKYYDMATDEATKKSEKPNYDLAMSYCDTAIQLGNMASQAGDIIFAANLLAGQCAQSTGNSDAMKKYYLPLTRSKREGVDMKPIYEALFQSYVKDNDTINAMKIARNFTRNYPDDYQADALLATAYLINGNANKGVEIMEKAVEKVSADPTKKAEALSIAAGFYERAKDITGAEAKYKESLSIDPTSFSANNGLATLNYNLGVDKIQAANDVPMDDETGAYDKLNNEGKEYFRASIPYFNAAINYIDGLPDDQKPMMRQQLHSSLKALNKVYAILEMYADAKAVEARIQAVEANN